MLAKLQAGRLIRWYVFLLFLWGQVELLYQHGSSELQAGF